MAGHRSPGRPCPRGQHLSRQGCEGPPGAVDGALFALARAGAVSAPFCRGQRVTLAVTAKAALLARGPTLPTPRQG
jgi:hypothetical protein